MNKLFGKTNIYWINLDRSKDRCELMEKNLNGSNHTRIAAIDGLEPDFEKKIKVINSNPNFTSALNAVLCSHLKAIHLAKKNNLEYVIILEDKCCFEYADRYEISIDNIIDKINDTYPQWQILQLSSIPLYDFNDYLKNGLRVNIYDSKYCGSNYLINRSGIDKILELVNTNGVDYFDFTKIINKINIENMLFKPLNSYMLNFPLFNICFMKSTFPYYFKNMFVGKTINQKLYLDAKEKMVNFFSDNKIMIK